MRHLHGRHEDVTWPVCLDLYDPGHANTLPPKFLISGSNGLFGGSTIKVFDVGSGDCLATFAQLRYDHKGSCTAVKITNNGTNILTAASDCTLAAWSCGFYLEEKKPMIKAGFFG
jgi:WD40 repeat protein